jgi:hypothetical protein
VSIFDQTVTGDYGRYAHLFTPPVPEDVEPEPSEDEADAGEAK